MRNESKVSAFTLVEVAVVAALLSVGLTLAITSIVDMVAVQKRNAALAEVNLILRELRGLALETRNPRYVKPSPSGNGVVIGQATTPSAGAGSCTENPGPTQTIKSGGLTVTGSRICFRSDGSTDESSSSLLTFAVPGVAEALAVVAVFPAGTMRWTGTSLSSVDIGLASSSLSVKTFATTATSVSQIR